MPKGYWFANLDVHDPDGFARYRDANREVMTRYGAKFIVAHGQQIVEEPPYRSMQTLVEFASYKDAVNCHDSPEYQAAAIIRQSASVGSLVIVEGYEGPQGLDL